MSNELIFEHPLNEKIRTYLRVETLFTQLQHLKAEQVDDANHMQSFLRILFDLNDVLDRCEWRSDLLKDLEKQRQLFKQWANVPQIDTHKVSELLERTNHYFTQINQHSKLSNFIKEDKLLAIIRQRLSLPGGTCSFDLPQLYYWQHQSIEKRLNDLEYWLQPFSLIAEVMHFLLNMLREQDCEETVTASSGFYQGQREGCILLRIKLPSNDLGFPTISGHKSRFAIKFMGLDGAIPHDIHFKLSCCRSLA